jgi:chitin disaccharide deacetylase
MKNTSTNRILGYPPDARLLILNADDFGMCHSVNAAIMRTLEVGPVRSTTVMVPCPWARHALHYLDDHPEIPFGVHLTVISDPLDYRWGPVAPREKVPSLVDREGYFYDFASMRFFLRQARLDELEIEFRAQIEAVLKAGRTPTHLDWHALRFGDRTDIFELMFQLAKAYGLALRVIGRPMIEKLQGQGLPSIDFDFLDSYGIDPATKAEHYMQLLHELPAGLSEWAVHPGLDSAELLALEPADNHERQSDYDFWISPLAEETIHKEGIILLDYRGLQNVWRNI